MVHGIEQVGATGGQLRDDAPWPPMGCHDGAVKGKHHTPRALAELALGLAIGAALILGGGVSARADVVCEDDGCDGGLWQVARGTSNEQSYWGMGAGHDCTNYVAWKLSSNGVVRPATGPGNAADWAANARVDGYLVDEVPAVGAVAQWGAYEGGSPREGHVAYVEQVNDDGTILVSEDSWNAEGTGPLKFRTLPASDVSAFIHYGDVAAWMRQVIAAPAGWTQSTTGLSVDATLISGAGMGGRSPQVVYLQEGQLHIARADSAGWHESPTGISSHTRSLSAINMGGAGPMVITVEGTALTIATRDARSWSSMDTGVDVSGDIAAVNAGGRWPTILVAQGGDLYTVTNGASGWSVAATGIEASGPITAASVGGALIDAYTVEDGTLYRLWYDGVWWHRDSTGLSATGSAAATALGGVSQVVVNDLGTLALAYSDGTGWHKASMGVAVGKTLTAVDMGGLRPVVIQNG